MAYCEHYDADMDAEQMPAVDRMDVEYSIYVKDVPVELNKDALRDIFSEYGEIIHVFCPRNASWAYITYGSYREAEIAIRVLNGKEPLKLKIALAKERLPVKEESQNPNIASERPKGVNIDSPSTHNDIKYQSMGRGQSVNTFRKHVMPQMTIRQRCTDGGSSSSSQPSLTHALSVSDIEDPCENSNRLWTRGLTTVTPDGKRHVSLGRGYTMYEFPEPDPKVEECITKVYEQRNSGLYEYSQDKFKNGVHSCIVCYNKTIKRCAKCSTYYCSITCQTEDWPRHRVECRRIPPLVEDTVNDISLLQINQHVDQTKQTSMPNVVSETKFNDVKLRRPNTFNGKAESSRIVRVLENSTSANIDMHKSDADATYNSINNSTHDRHLSAQRDNDINVSQTKMADPPRHSSAQRDNDINVSQTKMTDPPRHSSTQRDNDINVSQTKMADPPRHSSAQRDNDINVSQTKMADPPRHSSTQRDNDINMSQTKMADPPRHSSAQRDNDINVSQTKMADPPVVNATNTKEFSQQHRLRRYNNTNEKTDQLRKNDRYSSASTSSNQSHYSRNYQSNSNKASPNKERFDNNTNKRDRTYNNDRSQPHQSNYFQSDKSSASINRDNKQGNSTYNNDRSQPHQNNYFQSDKSSAPFNRENKQGNSTYNNDRSQPHQNNGFQSDKNSASINRRNSTSSNISVNDDLSFYKDTHLSKIKFITVEIILLLDNDEYWIYKLDDTDTRMNLMMNLQDVAKESRNMQPIIGEVYGVLYEDIWHRAMVISLNPIKVHFIDFGNDEILEKNAELKDIRDLSKAPKIARKIRLTQHTSEKYRNLQPGEKISVRMLSIDSEKTIIVEVQEQSNALSPNASNNAAEKPAPQENLKVSPNKSTKLALQIPSILDGFADLLAEKAVPELRINGFIQIHESAEKNVYCATLCAQVKATEFEMIFNDLHEECSKMEVSVDYKPKPEDLVCGKWNDGWYRGYISTSPNSCFTTVDEARILSVNKIIPCPEKFCNICSFGVMCEINNSTIEFEREKPYEFTAVINEQSHKERSLKIKIIANSEEIEAVIRPISNKVSTKTIPLLAELRNGSKICLTSYRNHYHMFARSLDEEEVEYYNNIMQRVAQCARKAPYLSEPPSKEDIVIAPYDDGNSYRAMVLETHNDKAKIAYIDFGNIDDVEIKNLQVVSPELALQRSCSAKIILKDVPCDISSNQEVDLYIRNLVGKEVPLVFTYEGASYKDGVRLTMPTGECVNDEINQLLIPGWKKENKDNKCYMLRDIEFANLGRVGDTVDAFVIFIQEGDRTKYVMSPADVELASHIFEVMPALLKECCEKTEYYIPRAQELCLALYEGAWYRAVCINPKESHTTSDILFIDYGNMEIIEHKNIRLMPKDFIVPPAIANMCAVVNLAPLDSSGNYSSAVQKKIAELVQISSTVKIKIVAGPEKDGDYKIELPDVRATLIKDGLVESS